jgi:predicted O-methyltransferase YrrM
VKRRVRDFLVNRFIDWNPTLFLNLFSQKHFDLLVRQVNRPAMFASSEVVVPEKVNGFEDLTFLFWSSPLNRGFLRQDLDEAATLFSVVRSMQTPKGAEIGRFHGGSTLLLAVAVGVEGKLLSIDLAPQGDELLNDMLRKLALQDRVELIIADANDVKTDDELDFVFIDADHSYEGARRDHNKWGSKVRTGGYIIHHDMAANRPYATQWDALKQLRSEILSRQSHTLTLIREVGSLSIFQRTQTPWHPIQDIQEIE